MRCLIKQSGKALLALVLCMGTFHALAHPDIQDPQQAAATVGESKAQASSEEGADNTGDTVAAVGGDANTTVYLIRESKFVGGARGVWVALNDKVVADLDSGTHVMLKLKPGLNTLNAVQAKAGFAYATIDNRGGQTAYLLMDYKLGTLTELPAEKGAALVKATKPHAAVGAPLPNDAHDNLLVNPELLGLGLIANNPPPLAPDAQSAVISFYRPARLIAEVPFSLWSRDGYTGSLRGGQYLQIRVAPGSHTFVALSERLSVLNATVEVGKEYAVEFDVGMGWNQAHVKLLPVNLGADAVKVDGWKRKAIPVGVSTEILQDPRVAPRLQAGFDYLKSIEAKWSAEDAASRALVASDGR